MASADLLRAVCAVRGGSAVRWLLIQRDNRRSGFFDWSSRLNPNDSDTVSGWANMNRIAAVQRRRNEVSRDCWDRFQAHRDRVSRLLRDAAPSDSGSLCLLGAGNSNDLDLNLLLSAFRCIHLVDLDNDALEYGVAAQNLHCDPRLRLHGEVDLSRLCDRSVSSSSPDRLTSTELEACFQHTPDLSLPEPCDTVASVCLLSQLLESVDLLLGEEHPRNLELKVHLRKQHLQLLLSLLVPGGKAVLVVDFVSSATCPQLPEIPESQLMTAAVQLIENRNFFTGVNPAAIGNLLRSDVDLRDQVDRVEMTAPWRWDFGSRIYLVCGILVQRKMA